MSSEYIVQRRIKHQKLRRKARRGEIMIRRLYKLVRFLFIIFIFIGTYKLAITHYWYLPQDIYEKPVGTNIEILGNNIVSNEKIINEMKKFEIPNKQIYKINPSEIAHGLEQLSPIKRAYIRRYWLPSRFVVMIEEVTPAITIAPTEDSPAVTAFAITGENIGREYLPLNEKINTVRILSYGADIDNYDKWDVEKINNLYKLGKLLEEYSGEKVKYIDLRVPHNAYVQLEKVKIKLGEIDASVYNRIKTIRNVIDAIEKQHVKTIYVDLSWKDTIYVKEDVKSK